MAPPIHKIPGAIGKAGKGLLKGGASAALKKARSRMFGKLALGSSGWTKAFPHIAEHFTEAALKSKPVHAIFAKKFASENGLKGLLQQAISKPSRTFLSRETVDGVASGRIVVLVEREFGEAIGEEVVRQTGKREPCKILRIVIDLAGNPITAYPVKKFFTAAAIAGVTMTGTSVLAVENAFADTQIAAENHDWCPYGVFDFLMDLTIIGAPSCTSPYDTIDPPGWIQQQNESRIKQIEKKLGFKLDPTTRKAVMKELDAIWGWGRY